MLEIQQHDKFLHHMETRKNRTQDGTRTHDFPDVFGCFNHKATAGGMRKPIMMLDLGIHRKNLGPTDF